MADLTKKFTYLGYQFSPLKKFIDPLALVASAKSLGFLLKDEPFKLNGFNSKDFYNAAKKVDADNYDLYLLNGQYQVIPCTRRLVFFKTHNPELYKDPELVRRTFDAIG